MDDDQSARVKLITLLNADSHRRAGKRKAGQDWHAIARSAAKQAKAASTRDDGSKAAVTAGQDGQVRREEEEAVIAADGQFGIVPLDGLLTLQDASSTGRGEG